MRAIAGTHDVMSKVRAGAAADYASPNTMQDYAHNDQEQTMTADNENLENLQDLLADVAEENDLADSDVEVEAPAMPDSPPAQWVSGGTVAALLGAVTLSDDQKVQIAAVIAAGIVAAIDRASDAFIRWARNKHR
jgi:hypothetical protein